MKNNVFTALRSFQFNSTVEAEDYYEALRLAAEAELDPGEPKSKVTRGLASAVDTTDWNYLVAHYLVQPELELLAYNKRDLHVGLGHETYREALAFKLATLLAPVDSLWKHYNRPETFKVLAVARYYDRNEQFVVFCNADHPNQIWMRTVDDFFSRIRRPGSLNPPETGDGWRFIRIDEVEDTTVTETHLAQQLSQLYRDSGDTIIREQQDMLRTVFTRYLKLVGSKVKYLAANHYRSGAMELAFEDDTSTPTSLWVDVDAADPNPGQTILFVLGQHLHRTKVVSHILCRAELEVYTLTNNKPLEAKEEAELLEHISNRYTEDLVTVFGEISHATLRRTPATSGFDLLISVPNTQANQITFKRFNGSEVFTDNIALLRKWETPTKE